MAFLTHNNVLQGAWRVHPCKFQILEKQTGVWYVALETILELTRNFWNTLDLRCDSPFCHLLAMRTWASLVPLWESASLAMSGKYNSDLMWLRSHG